MHKAPLPEQTEMIGLISSLDRSVFGQELQCRELLFSIKGVLADCRQFQPFAQGFLCDDIELFVHLARMGQHCSRLASLQHAILQLEARGKGVPLQ